MAHQGFVVPPRSTKDIYHWAGVLRKVFGSVVTSEGYLPIDVVYELLPTMLEGFDFQVREMHEMGSDHGRTYPSKKLIELRLDVYEGMCKKQGRDRFTAAHELGHLFLHNGVAFARAMEPSTKIYCNSEWQANTFASALLIDEKNLKLCRSIDEVALRFGVTLDAAKVRFK